MKVNTKLRMLPFDYLERIGRYDPEVHRAGPGWPGYPKDMMKELEMVARTAKKVRFIRNWNLTEHTKAIYKHKKFVTVEIRPSRNKWIIPSNWVVRV